MSHLRFPCSLVPAQPNWLAPVSQRTMQSAQLIHRGEEFQFVDRGSRYEGTCLWSWEEVPGGTPRRTGPIYIYAHSIRRTGFAGLIPLGIAKKIAIARQTQVLLKTRDSGLDFVVVEDMPKAAAQRRGA